MGPQGVSPSERYTHPRSALGTDSDTDTEEQKAEANLAGTHNRGPSISCFWDGKREDFADGFGLCSPGRWDPANRGIEMSEGEWSFCEKLSAVVDKHLDFCDVSCQVGDGVLDIVIGHRED